GANGRRGRRPIRRGFEGDDSDRGGQFMASPTTRRLVVAATLVQSILAGVNVNRAVVEMPAWQRTGPLAWATFSRHADLARRAAVLYPLSAFVGLILSIAAVVRFRRDQSLPRSATIPLHGAALMGAA